MTYLVSALGSRPLGTILSIHTTLVRKLKYIRTIRQLEQLDDHMLKDVGLSRGDIFYFKSHPRRLSIALSS